MPFSLVKNCAWGSNCKTNLSTSNALSWSDKLCGSILTAVLTMVMGIFSGIDEGLYGVG
jgi:hypothetical protein